MDSIIGFILNRLLIFLLLGVLASLCHEAIAGFLGVRSIYLAQGLRSLMGRSKLSDGTLLIKKFYNHGLVHSLHINSGRRGPQSVFLRDLFDLPSLEQTQGLANTRVLPSYIPSHTFAMDMVDILNLNKLNGSDPLVNIESELFNLHHSTEPDTDRLAECLISMLVDAARKEDPLLAFEQSLEGWFDNTMDQVSAKYKRYADRSLIMISLLFAFIFNVNAIRVEQVQSGNADINQTVQSVQDSYLKAYFKNHPPQAKGALSSAEQQPNLLPPVPSKPDNASSLQRELAFVEQQAINARREASSKITAPFGWQDSLADYKAWWGQPDMWNIASLLNKFAGWLITAYVARLFARLWFDFSRKVTLGWTNRKEG